jgi:hypothetical protein
LTIAIVLTTAFLVYVALSTKSKHVALSGFDKAKYELHKYHAERYWGIFVAGMLIRLYFLGVPWMPPVAFSQAIQHPEKVHTISIVAGQWFWKIEDGGIGTGPSVAAPINIGKINPSSPEGFVSSQKSGQESIKTGLFTHDAIYIELRSNSFHLRTAFWTCSFLMVCSATHTIIF